MKLVEKQVPNIYASSLNYGPVAHHTVQMFYCQWHREVLASSTVVRLEIVYILQFSKRINGVF